MSTLFGRTLRQLRRDAGLTQVALADACNLDHTYISKLEAGKQRASIATLSRLADVLCCPRDVLFNADCRVGTTMTRQELERRAVDLEATVAAFKAHYGPLPTTPPPYEHEAERMLS